MSAKPEQTVIDFDAAADTVILIAIDGREVEVPRRGPGRRCGS